MVNYSEVLYKNSAIFGVWKGQPWRSSAILFKNVGFLTPTDFLRLFAFPIFWIWANLISVIPQTRRAY